MLVVKAPNAYPVGPRPLIFLAGSIEQGAAEPWQAELEAQLADLPGVLLNPRRDEWDAGWRQAADNPQFAEQVNWELAALEQADLIPMYFDPATKSPITLLELGLFSSHGKLIVCCPDGYWRKGNVEIVCSRYGEVLVQTREEFLAAIRRRVVELQGESLPQRLVEG